MIRETRQNPVVTSRQLHSTGARLPGLAKKLLGGNIVIKGGSDWRHLWAEWDWDRWIRPQVDRAIKLGLQGVRLIGSPIVTQSVAGVVSWSAWAANTAYAQDFTVAKGGRAYRCTTAGTSASSGGPSGTGAAISDGTVVWEYLRDDNLTTLTQDQYDARWAQLIEYCATKGLYVYPCLCEKKNFDWLGSAQYQNATLTASIVTTAQRLSAYPNVIGFDLFQEGDVLIGGTRWVASTAYGVGNIVNNGGKAYTCTTAGTSASSGGPSGTGTGITDGSCVWSYSTVPLMPDDALAMLAAVRAVSNVPLTVSAIGSPLKEWWQGSRLDFWHYLYAADAGPDFLDIHVYESSVTAFDIDSFGAFFGKPVLVGEFGVDQSMSSDAQAARLAAVNNLLARPGVMGGFVWGLADQGYRPAYQAGAWDNTGYSAGASPSALSTASGARAVWKTALSRTPRAQPALADQVTPLESYNYTNLVAGSGFELDSHPWVLGSKWSVTTDQHSSGSESLVCAPGGAGKCTLRHDYEVYSGDRIVVTLRARRTSDFNGSSGNCKLRISDQNDSSIGQIAFGLADIASADTWTTLTGYVDIGSSTTKVKIALWFCDHTAGSIYLDNIYIRRGTPISALIPSTSSPLGVGSVEVGHASDTTVTRREAGVIDVEGVVQVSRAVMVTLTGAATAPAAAGRIYPYLLGSGAALTLPTAVGNTSTYELKNIHTANLTIGATAGQTFDGATTLTLSPDEAVTLRSDNSNWRIF